MTCDPLNLSFGLADVDVLLLSLHLMYESNANKRRWRANKRTQETTSRACHREIVIWLMSRHCGSPQTSARDTAQARVVRSAAARSKVRSVLRTRLHAHSRRTSCRGGATSCSLGAGALPLQTAVQPSLKREQSEDRKTSPERGTKVGKTVHGSCGDWESIWARMGVYLESDSRGLILAAFPPHKRTQSSTSLLAHRSAVAVVWHGSRSLLVLKRELAAIVARNHLCKH